MHRIACKIVRNTNDSEPAGLKNEHLRSRSIRREKPCCVFMRHERAKTFSWWRCAKLPVSHRGELTQGSANFDTSLSCAKSAPTFQCWAFLYTAGDTSTIHCCDKQAELRHTVAIFTKPPTNAVVGNSRRVILTKSKALNPESLKSRSQKVRTYSQCAPCALALRQLAG